jgi:hypothetical protein
MTKPKVHMSPHPVFWKDQASHSEVRGTRDAASLTIHIYVHASASCGPVRS